MPEIRSYMTDYLCRFYAEGRNGDVSLAHVRTFYAAFAFALFLPRTGLETYFTELSLSNISVYYMEFSIKF